MESRHALSIADFTIGLSMTGSVQGNGGSIPDTVGAVGPSHVFELLNRGPEAESMYDSDMAVYIGRGNPDVEKNIALMKQWAAEGK